MNARKLIARQRRGEALSETEIKRVKIYREKERKRQKSIRLSRKLRKNQELDIELYINLPLLADRESMGAIQTFTEFTNLVAGQIVAPGNQIFLDARYLGNNPAKYFQDFGDSFYTNTLTGENWTSTLDYQQKSTN